MEDRPASAGKADAMWIPTWLLSAVGVAACTWSPAPVVDPSEQDREIRLGMVTAVSGPAASLGANMRAGVLAALEEANARGGVGWVGEGRKIRLIVRDDGYEPARTGPALRDLIAKDGVIGVVGNVGTPTGVVALPICRETGVLFIAPFTGAGALRTVHGQPVDPVAFHFRASYAEETEAMVAGLVDHGGLALDEIAVFSQRDAYGDAGYAGVLDAMRRRGLKDGKPLHVRYERNTLAVESAAADCLSAPVRPKAVIMIGTYAPSSAFVRTCIESDYRPRFLSVSFVGAEALAKELGALGDGVIVTQVVPTLDSDVPAVRDLEAALERLPTDLRVRPCLGALEGYVVGKIMVEALSRTAGGEAPTSRSVAASLESLRAIDVGIGATVSLSDTDHQASHRIWPSVIRGGRVVSFEWRELRGVSSADRGVAEPSGGARPDASMSR